MFISQHHHGTILYYWAVSCWKRWVFNPDQNCPLEIEDQRKCFGRLFQMTRAARLKLHLRSSVPVLGTAISPRSAEWRPARPERFAICMQTCRKYAAPAPRIQLNARSAVLNCIHWDISNQCRTWRNTGVICSYLPQPMKSSCPVSYTVHQV